MRFQVVQFSHEPAYFLRVPEKGGCAHESSIASLPKTPSNSGDNHKPGC
jgi:hypothetical protein